MVMWTSKDQGAHWAKVSQLTVAKYRNNVWEAGECASGFV